jgi:hypothetical protein
MFPFTQIKNLYNWYYYEEIKCMNPTCNKIFLSEIGKVKATHCSIGCGFSHYSYEEKERAKEKERISTEQKKFLENYAKVP